MIRKQDILDRAAEWRLRPDVVEKDYVLGWLLAALARSDVRTTWVFKGGTSIKKCFFETYRFSEDLDFSLTPEAPYTEAAIRESLQDLARTAAELSGVEFPPDRVEVRVQRNRQGQPTFQGRIAYRGPLGVPTFPRVLLDLTQHEAILDAPVERVVFHPYPDAPDDGLTVATYSFDEILAEKTRALLERSRPRDLYDVVFLLENSSESFDLAAARKLFQGKCAGKHIATPSAVELVRIVSAAPELRSEWSNMLAHQLPVLPVLDELLRRLPPLLGWIDEPRAAPPEVRLAAVPGGARETVVAPAGIRYWGSGLPLEAIRFAGASRLLVEFDYHGKHRVVEPYSLRRPQTTGNLLLYGWEQASAQMKAFKVAEMGSVRATGTSFQPRYRIEFTPHGGLSAPPTRSPARIGSSRPRPVGGGRGSGPVYVFECTYCGKRFRHAKNDPTIRKHKQRNVDWDCPGRRGHFVGTEWR
ncbi:MAG: nucleotidyl transferase AbiEii/AbiGii toxin family protein [Thermodesulfobacteriota bacterium]